MVAGVAEESQRAQVPVVVADDDEQNARLLVRILESGGYEKVECTTQSAEVLPLCLEHRPDLLLLDVSMPSPNGFEILEAIATADPPRPAVVMLTGHDHPAIERQALDLGAAKVIGKTTSMGDLLACLDEVLVESGRFPEEDVGA